jgi:hypothetical protein
MQTKTLAEKMDFTPDKTPNKTTAETRKFYTLTRTLATKEKTFIFAKTYHEQRQADFSDSTKPTCKRRQCVINY